MNNDTQLSMPTKYEPRQTEGKWYQYWLDHQFFKPSEDPQKEPFTIVIPPPNVTGRLHLGHAWDGTLQDIIIRIKRMQGYDALWLPGMDHAGIATQARVEAKLKEEGKTRYDLGREAFVKQVWEWKEEYASVIREQWAKLGLSLDYSRERFTLDEGLSKAVREVFVRLYEKGLIYRGKYIINWDPETRTALSDIEVEYKEINGHLYHLRYPLVEGSGSIEVATTRPETMLGDTAVAVHPEDERYKHLIGKTVKLPIVGREIPIIADEYVDMAFGSGAVKITPAHDPNDFEIGQRHNLEQILVMDESGRMNENAGPYQGLDRFECRKLIVKDLQDQGVLFKIEDHVHSVGHSQRSGAVVEPYLSTQWFVKMKPLAEQAIRLQHEADTKVNFVPERFEKIYLHWIENVRDWCISRQLWWGHRIPAWYTPNGDVIVARTEEEATHIAQEKYGTTDITQDEDVLDTWFSSGLWPFSTMGWPDETADMKRYYPTDCLVTGYDIIYFWVARMIFTALEFTHSRPFKDVLIHGLIRDAEGRKMSKSLGNGVDPMDVIEKHGADALRFMLATGSSPGHDLRFHWEKVEAARNFANKIWNASRFALMNLQDFDGEKTDISGELSTPNRWILHRLNHTVREVTKLADQYEFGEVGRLLYHFIWDEFCDWYIEMAKIPLYGDDAGAKRETQAVLAYTLDRTLRLLHPFMPFITEEIWQHLPGSGASITVASWPEARAEFDQPDAEKEMALIMDVIRAVRNIRAEVNVPLGKAVDIMIKPSTVHHEQYLRGNEDIIARLTNPHKLEISTNLEVPEQAMSSVVSGAEIYLPLAGLIDVEQELARLDKEKQKLEAEVARAEQKLANKGFTAKAPQHIVEAEREKLKDYQEQLQQVQERINELKKMS
ncbi:valyl-tRNA synthetase [Caldalkalibacillus uzonensis]|uniref:Valine--tRNA ligase n=1 Tax=Caldalkalibacillus uzonensis TaxID=353224 RepID=A0ABU0CSX3_9BACI|nr:valine--tRNA ligase [Caldalkalibacillus uzonensis]MDQ0339485.1 valyl-tRNA synthetase [Caldalkalibacillus uzonensis]